jgi:DNA-binding winged helix-turn-helix (wHTH) protein/tetratricopeptide (TPR) repeat protein
VVIDCERRTIHVGGEERHLRAKSFDVFVYLARRAGRMVSKKELFEQVWAGSAVTDDSLVQCLIDIRRVLGEHAERIRTVRGHGYLLDAEVRECDAAPLAARTLASEPPPSEPVDLSPGHRGSRRAVAVWAVMGIVTVAALLSWQSSRDGNEAAGERRIAPQASMDSRVDALMQEGERSMQSRSQPGLQRARDLYESVIAIDAQYAPAHAALSNTLSVLHAFAVERPAQLLPPAHQHALRAIELDPTVALGWHALAHAQVHWTREWAAAEANYRRAIALDPTDINPQFLLAHLLMGLKRPEEAVRQSLHARSLDPGAMLTTSSGIVHYFTRRFEEALGHLDRALADDPTFATASFWRALTLAALGRTDEAMQSALAARRSMGNAPTWIVGYVHARSGRLAEARDVLQALETHRRARYVPAIELAYLSLALGDRERALALLAESVDEHSRWIELIAVDPILDPLRGEPRFQALVARMGLPSN